MKDSDEVERLERAKQLRKQISELTNNVQGGPKREETPAEFIHRRMLEIDQKKSGSED